MNAPGTLFVIAAPSGTGKTTLVKTLVETIKNLRVSISHTTRKKRPAEANHAHYHFVDEATFQTMVQEEVFLEHAEIFHHQYGTSKHWVRTTLHSGVDVILEIDWQGYQQIKQLMPETIGIFILPPSRKDLERRLSSRSGENPQAIAERLKDAKEAASHVNEFDYIIVNDDYQQAILDLTHIIEATRLTRQKQCLRCEALIQSLT